MASAREHTLPAAGGMRLFVRDWLVDFPCGSVVILHGLGEHCGRYARVACFLNERGWSVRTYDHRGHGQSAGPLTAFQKLLLKCMSAAAPGVAVKNNVKSRYISHDEKVVKAYDTDPLVHDRITARLLNGMLAAIDFAHARASSLAIPVLLQVAGDDHLVDASGSKAFHARLPAGLRTMHWYDDLYHEIFNEIDAQRVFDDLGNWLAARQTAGVERQASAA